MVKEKMPKNVSDTKIKSTYRFPCERKTYIYRIFGMHSNLKQLYVI